LLLKGLTGRPGLIISLAGVVAILWLGATGRLELYIHPRYIPFTIIMALIGAAFALAGFLLASLTRHEHDDHDDHAEHGPREGTDRKERFRAVGSLVTVAAAVVGLLILPPSPLSSATARQRDVNASGTLSKFQTDQLVGQDDSAFNVRDWASLLRHPPTENYLTGKTATVTGFVTADKTDPANVFFVTRFFVTCCAVDGQPVGVPVHDPGWQKRYKTDTWVTATGSFDKEPNTNGNAPIVLIPDEISLTTQPTRPYVY
jgi:uncharacterized repeat protein (TIGR03943 family)